MFNLLLILRENSNTVSLTKVKQKKDRNNLLSNVLFFSVTFLPGENETRDKLTSGLLR